MNTRNKAHAICLPFPAQGHINPMFKLAKLLHHKGGYRVTFVNTEYNHRRLLKSRGPNSLDGLPDFQFRTIPDGLPPQSNEDSAQNIVALFLSTSKNCLLPFYELIRKLNGTSSLSSCLDVPPVTCIVCDTAMAFGVEAAQVVGVPCVSFFTASSCGLLAYTQFPFLVQKGIMPPKDASWLTNGYSEKTLDWIPALHNVRLKDLPSSIATINPDHGFIDYVIEGLRTLVRCSAIVLNTFDAFEGNALDGLANILPPIYAVGPLQLFQIDDTEFKHLTLSLWNEESECLDWLSTKEANSVVYVNFGSIIVLTPDQMIEFAWGLANSNYSFLWIIRPDLVVEESAILPQDFVVETQGKCMLTSWCPQERVLMHSSI